MSGTVWVRAASFADLEAAAGLLGVEAAGRQIALYAIDGHVFATANLCSHGAARLSDGYLDGDLIECPLHQGLFSVRDGSVAGPPCTRPVRSYPARRDGDDVLIEVKE